MARPLRIEYPGAVYHVMSRGNAKEPVYDSDSDRNLFLKTIEESKDRFNILIHGYCLMDNHYHLLIETPDGNLSDTMRHINGLYTQRFNRSHKRVGHIFQGRYKAILVDKENYLLVLSRYIVLNPVRADIVKHPKDYKWSSFRDTAGLRSKQEFLTVDWVLRQFGDVRHLAQEKYCQYVLSNKDEDPFKDVKGNSILGSKSFISRLTETLWDKEEIKEVPRHQRYVARPPLDALFDQDTWPSEVTRDKVVEEAVVSYGYNLTEVADFLGVHYTTISKIVRRNSGDVLQK
jgi:REP element-mobilizing transposase RayT